MTKTWLSAVFGTAILLALPTVSSAAPGHGGGGGGGGRGGSGGRGGGGYGGGGYGGRYGGGGFYGGGGLYLGLGLGGYGYPYYGAPSAYVGPSTYVYPPPSTSYYYSPPAYTPPPAAPVMPPATDPTNAVIEVRVPADAEIWFDGERTTQTGNLRSFETASIPRGKFFTYDVRARWTGSDGKPVDLTRSVQFQSGQRITLDFTHP